LENPLQAVDLLKKHGLVALDNVPWVHDKEKLFEFSKMFGEPCPPVKIQKLEGYDLPSFGQGEPTVEEIVKTTKSNHDQPTVVETWHQDSAYYKVEQTVSMATVDLSELPPGEKTCDTAFSTMMVPYEKFSNEFKNFLRKLTIKHSYKRLQLLDNMIANVMLKYINIKTPAQILETVNDIKSRMPDPTQQSLIQQSPWGFEYMIFSMNSEIEFLELSKEESDSLVEFIGTQLLKPEYIYSHQWRPNQLVIWDNQRLMHTIVRNGSVNETRKLARIQVAIK
jgi:alpha-ketoglutarate-dependent taurine dioxygenase